MGDVDLPDREKGRDEGNEKASNTIRRLETVVREGRESDVLLCESRSH